MTIDSASKSNKTILKLQDWVQQTLRALKLGDLAHFEALSGDASFRRYYRLHTENSRFIAVHAPPETEKNAEFILIAERLAGSGIRVPTVLASDLQEGFLLQEDLGDQLLLSALNGDSANGLYAKALRMAEHLATLDTTGLPSYHADRMHEDLQRFPEWFVQGLLDRPITALETEIFERFCQLIISECTQQPQAFTHYDFQSRNLMLCEDGELAAIDFQDGLLAPVTYDLASLIRDCYIKWPGEQVKAWALQYANAARTQGSIPSTTSDAQFLRWFDAVSLQRHVRVLGTFARLFLRDNKPGYLPDIPLVCDYVLEVSANLPEAKEFHDWFAGSLMDSCKAQDWYQNRRANPAETKP